MARFNFLKNRGIKHRAFTLVELLVVISIIRIISSIAILSLSSSKASGRDAKRIADLKAVRNALESYATDNSEYPTCGQAVACTNSYCDCTTVGWGANWANMEIKPNYIGNMPVDPTNAAPYGYYYARGYKPSGNCSYALTNLSSDYIIATRLENPSNVSGSCPGGFGAWGQTLNFISGSGR